MKRWIFVVDHKTLVLEGEVLMEEYGLEDFVTLLKFEVLDQFLLVQVDFDQFGPIFTLNHAKLHQTLFKTDEILENQRISGQ